MKQFAFTLDLETDYAGYMHADEIFLDLNRIDEVLYALTSLNVKITVFTVANIFEQYPDVINLFEKYNCEFEAHSYSHDFRNPDSEHEIEKAKNAYYAYFNKYPRGYRSPRGIISHAGIKRLEKHGFLYDSSIFPSYFPNPFRYLFARREVHYHNGSEIMEIPFTSVSPFRITLSVSYIKLLGVDFFIKLSHKFNFPDIICFDSHLHDFIHVQTSYNKLSPVWRLLYRRNKLKGLECCMTFLNYVKARGYEFCFMSDIYERYRDKRQP